MNTALQLGAALLAGAAGYFSNGLAPLDAGGATLSVRDCAGCHADIAREWQQSRHAAAWTNGIFQNEYQGRPLAWCVRCHAPIGAQGEAVASGRVAGDGSLADEGVSCAACHLRGGRLHAQHRRQGSPHDTVEVEDFGGPSFCAGCHELSFPHIDADQQVRRYTQYPMQTTVSQFRAGPAAEIDGGCRGCHAQSRFAHRYPGGHDPTMVRQALALDVCRADRGSLRLRLDNAGAGHNVPTGDVHRHLTLRAWRPSAPARLWEAFLGRRFQPDEAGGKRTVWDSTLPAGEGRDYVVALAPLGGEPGEPVSLELRLVYAAREFPSQDLGEPAYLVIERREVQPAELPPCGTIQAALVLRPRRSDSTRKTNRDGQDEPD